MSDPLSIDFDDRDDVRRKLPHVRAILEQKERRLRTWQDDYDSYRAYAEVLAHRAGVELSDTAIQEPPSVPDAEPNGTGQGDHLELVVSVVDQAGRAVKAREVAAILRHRGVDITNSAVSNALYYAANRATPPRVRKLPIRGMYASLGYSDQPLTDYAVAAVHEMPAPDHLPANDDDEL
jgi:hypothetical protein